MNERIKELAHQAGYNWIKFDSEYKEERGNMLSHNTAYDLEKFADLILRECMDIISDGGEFASRPKLIEKLQDHFGIES